MNNKSVFYSYKKTDSWLHLNRYMKNRETESMGKHFLTVLGTGVYKNTEYFSEEGGYETSFIQEAVLKLKLSEWNPGDKITVFITEESKNRNWLNRPFTEREIEEAKEKGEELPEIKIGLEQILKEQYEGCIESCIIPVGANEEELWEIFRNIFDTISQEEELYIDITHALRNIPIQLLAVISYARAIKNVTVSGIYYGAFEVGKFNEKGVKAAPILNLLTFLDILDWSQAANEFIKYGNSDQIVDLYHEQKRRIGVRQPELSKVVMELQSITHGLETSRGYFDKENAARYKKGKSILESYKQYEETFEIMEKKDRKEHDRKKQQKSSIEPLNELFHTINEKVKIFQVETNLELGLAAIKWAVENKKTQQGFTALEETMKTFLCNHYGFPEAEELYRDKICKSACIMLYMNFQGKKAGECTEEFRRAIYLGWKEERKEWGIAPEILEEAENIFLTIPERMLFMCHEISDCRNSMNHFGYSNKGNYSYKDLEGKLEKYYNELLQMIEDMTRGKAKHE